MSGRGYSRRAVAIGGGIAAALGITALGVTVPRLLGHRYRESAYDDLFAQLQDRDAAVRVGRAALNGRAGLAGPSGNRSLARGLRQRLERRTLREVTDSDVAQDSLTEVQGWVMPATVVLLAILAADEG